MGRVSHGKAFPGGPNANTSTFKGVIGRDVMTEADNGQEFEKTLGDSGGQRNLVCCSPWGCKESDTT